MNANKLESPALIECIAIMRMQYNRGKARLNEPTARRTNKLNSSEHINLAIDIHLY